jgi:hypothetical protein
MLNACLLAVLAQVPPPPVIVQPPAGGWLAVDAPVVLGTFPPDAGKVDSVEFQARPDDGGTWSQGNVVVAMSTAGKWVPGAAVGATHLSAWCFRARWSNEAGVSGFSDERCVQFDLVPPSAPLITDVRVVGGKVEVAFTPADDANSGVEGYWLLVYGSDPGAYGSSFNHGFTTGSPARTYLGLGSWRVSLETRDRARNYAGTELMPITVVPTMVELLQPDPPALRKRYASTAENVLVWSPTDAGYIQHRYRFREADGGLSVWLPWDIFGSTIVQRDITLGRARPVIFQSASIDEAGNTSPWSIDSEEGGWDDESPSTPNVTALVREGRLTVQSSASDEWSGVERFESELSRGTESRMAVGDTVSWEVGPGTYSLSVRAFDRAGRASAPMMKVISVNPPEIPGVADAGVPDAGAPTAPGARELAVGCGCGQVGQGGLLGLLALRWRRRR